MSVCIVYIVYKVGAGSLNNCVQENGNNSGETEEVYKKQLLLFLRQGKSYVVSQIDGFNKQLQNNSISEGLNVQMRKDMKEKYKFSKEKVRNEINC